MWRGGAETLPGTRESVLPESTGGRGDRCVPAGEQRTGLRDAIRDRRGGWNVCAPNSPARGRGAGRDLCRADHLAPGERSRAREPNEQTPAEVWQSNRNPAAAGDGEGRVQRAGTVPALE